MTTTGMTTAELLAAKGLAAEMKKELVENILPYWMKKMCNGEEGFYGRITGEEVLEPAAPVGGIMTARILWTFASAYRVLGNQEYLDMALKAKNLIINYFYDSEFGGTYWSLNPDYTPLDTKKQIYAIAFTIYGLAELHRATGDAEALEYAVKLFHSIEDHSFDQEKDGYFEAFTREWEPIEDMRLSEKDANESKTMNTHLHILEPYTNLYLLTNDGRVADAVARLLDIFHSRIYNEESGHLGSFFSSEWKRLDSEISYGHDIESSWLICEAADAIGASERMYYDMADRLVLACEDGFRDDGSLVYRCESGSWDEERHWWVQAEAVVGLMKMYRRSGDERWLDKCRKVWEYILGNMVDRQGGEWYWSRLSDGSVNMNEDKAGFWKCPYHNGRMCVEMLKELV